MRAPPQVRMLPDGRRLHLQHGPIDLVVEAFGAPAAVAGAYRNAMRRFDGVLDELCDELALLRSPAGRGAPNPRGPVARRMAEAVAPFAARCFITPMAAVAGAVADEILAVMMAAGGLDRAYVNNGGDIALHCAPERSFVVGMIDRPDRPSLFGQAVIDADCGIGGLATSGWRGRSFSLGVADSVTVLASTAAEADAAATVIANAVDLPGHPAVTRAPADSLQPDSDLGSRLVTRDVGRLTAVEIDDALAAGQACAEALQRRGLVHGAALHLQGITRVADALPGGASEAQPLSYLSVRPQRSANESGFSPRTGAGERTIQRMTDGVRAVPCPRSISASGGAAFTMWGRMPMPPGGSLRFD